MITRRQILVGTGIALAAPRSAWSQQGKTVRVGFYYFASRKSAIDTGRHEAFVQAMRELGYIIGKNMVLEERYAEGRTELLAALTAELLNAKVDVIVATGGPIYRALRQATATVPVVMTVSSEPVSEGYAQSLAKPGGNFTGFTVFSNEIVTKLLELMHESVPKLRHVGVLLNPNSLAHPAVVVRLMSAAQRIGVRVWLAEAGTAQEIEDQFKVMAQNGVQAVILMNDTFYVEQFRNIAAHALRHRLPSITAIREYSAAGGLMSYAADITDNFRRAASYVDKIVKGAKPSALPIEQPSRYYLEINGRTAKTLGLAIPSTVMVRATKVIE